MTLQLELPLAAAPAAVVPTRRELWVRRLKVLGLSARRLVSWQLQADQWPAPCRSGPAAFSHTVYQVCLPILRSDGDAHPLMEQGKLRNLELAAARFDGLRLQPDRILSFWRCLGRVRAEAGYQMGMELRGGCIVPSLGGGLCMLSNALFQMGARLGFEVVERHGHTVEAVPSQEEPWGLDATVFWPYVDLRLRPNLNGVLRVRVEDGMLHLSVLADSSRELDVELWSEDDRTEGRIRSNRIRRRVQGRAEVIAVNRKRLTHSQERRRNCYTCGHLSCPGRPK